MRSVLAGAPAPVYSRTPAQLRHGQQPAGLGLVRPVPLFPQKLQLQKHLQVGSCFKTHRSCHVACIQQAMHCGVVALWSYCRCSMLLRVTCPLSRSLPPLPSDQAQAAPSCPACWLRTPAGVSCSCRTRLCISFRTPAQCNLPAQQQGKQQ